MAAHAVAVGLREPVSLEQGAEARLRVAANGDFHRLERLASWKTLLPCEQTEEAIIDFLRSPARAHLTVFDPVAHRIAA